MVHVAGAGLALRAGRATFSDVLKDYGALAGVSDLAFKVLPLQTKIRIGLPAAAKIFLAGLRPADQCG